MKEDVTNLNEVVVNCNILIQSLEKVQGEVSNAEKEGYRGFAKTMMAHQFLVLYSSFYNSGIRLDVSDPQNFGAVVTDTAVVLEYIRDLLDQGQEHLDGAAFAFDLLEGFEGFDEPATFTQFNQALAARAALYAGDMASAIAHLSNSFFDINGSMAIGPKVIFSTSGGDILNDLYKTPQQNGNQIVVSNTWINDAAPGDLRVTNKAVLRDNPTSKSGINATHETRLYASATSPIDIIRNEELILIYAEANIGVDNNAALMALNRIRSEAGLGNLAGTVTLDQVLFERRYSLWGEAHRMVDLRRTGRLNTTYVGLDPVVIGGKPVKQVVFQAFPLPNGEEGN